MPEPRAAPNAAGARDPLRWRASTAALRSRWDAHLAARRERAALEQLGAALASTARAPAPGGRALDAAHAGVAACDARIEALRAALAGSLEEDRTDYGEVGSWLRPVVVFRGIATRCLLRDRLRRARKGRAAAYAALGGAALDERIPLDASAGDHATTARAARERAAAAAAEHEAHLASLQGAPVPTIARHAAREAVALGKPIVHEVKGRVFPRVPALAGLAVGWWIARTFTDSRFSATLHALGIGSGPRRVVSSGQLHAMEFWLPIAAAAICSYASGRVAALVRARYARAPEQDASSPAVVDPARDDARRG